MVNHINLIIDEVKKEFPDFGLTGTMIAQGEDADDTWAINIVDGRAARTEIIIKGHEAKCPHCGESFTLNTVE